MVSSVGRRMRIPLFYRGLFPHCRRDWPFGRRVLLLHGAGHFRRVSQSPPAVLRFRGDISSRAPFFDCFAALGPLCLKRRLSLSNIVVVTRPLLRFERSLFSPPFAVFFLM